MLYSKTHTQITMEEKYLRYYPNFCGTNSVYNKYYKYKTDLQQNQADAQYLKYILFWNNTLHVSDGISVHLKEFKTVHTVTGICQTDTATCLLARTRCSISFSVLFVCICVLYYCHWVAIQLQLNISYHRNTVFPVVICPGKEPTASIRQQLE